VPGEPVQFVPQLDGVRAGGFGPVHNARFPRPSGSSPWRNQQPGVSSCEGGPAAWVGSVGISQAPIAAGNPKRGGRVASPGNPSSASASSIAPPTPCRGSSSNTCATRRGGGDRADLHLGHVTACAPGAGGQPVMRRTSSVGSSRWPTNAVERAAGRIVAVIGGHQDIHVPESPGCSRLLRTGSRTSRGLDSAPRATNGPDPEARRRPIPSPHGEPRQEYRDGG
jgi:hypothetical protein